LQGIDHTHTEASVEDRSNSWKGEHLIMRLLGVCLLVTTAVLIHAAPHKVQKRVANLPLIPGDENVSSLAALKAAHKAATHWSKLEKRKPTRETSQQVSKSSHSVYSNVDGNKHHFQDQKEKVIHNGELLSLLHKTKEGNAIEGQKPHEKDLTEISIPRLGINNKIISKDGVQVEVKNKRNGGGSQARYTPDDLAQYILDTGDQASVVQFLQDLIQNGKISEEEALMYVDSIKGRMEEEEKVAMEEQQELDDNQDTNKMVMKINDYLDRQMQEGQIPEKLYSNLKDTLMESLLRDLRMQLDQANELDYPGY